MRLGLGLGLTFILIISLGSVSPHFLEFGGGNYYAYSSSADYLYLAKQERLEKYAWLDIISNAAESTELKADEITNYEISDEYYVRQINDQKIVFYDLQDTFYHLDLQSQAAASVTASGTIFASNVAYIHPRMFYTSTGTSLIRYSWDSATQATIGTMGSTNMKVKLSQFSTNQLALLVYKKNIPCHYYIYNTDSDTHSEKTLPTNFGQTAQTSDSFAATLVGEYVFHVTSTGASVYRFTGSVFNNICSQTATLVFKDNASNDIHITEEGSKIFALFGQQDFHLLTLNTSTSSCTLTNISFQAPVSSRLFAIYRGNQAYVFDSGIQTTVFPIANQSNSSNSSSSEMNTAFLIALAVTIPSIILMMIIVFICCLRSKRRRPPVAIQNGITWDIEEIMRAQTPIDELKEGIEAGHECPICLQNVKTNGIRTKCEHVFHTPCMRTWLATKDTCPMCREPLS